VATSLATLLLAACGLGITGNLEPASADAGYELPPAADDAATEADATVEVDAAPACRPDGDRCSRQSDCCAPSFCGRDSYYSSYSCHACLAPQSRCSSDSQCCGKDCVPVTQYERRCR
jgi:hypothetical protein